jgi:hypothetical protein
MKTIAGLLLITLLTISAACAKQDWIDRTLVTVDVTGTWEGSVVGAGGGAMGGRHVVLELQQQGPTVKGSIRTNPGTPGSPPTALRTVEGTVTGDVFRFKDPRGNWQGELTVSGDEMDGRVSFIGSVGQISLRRSDPASPPASPPR